MIEAAEAFRVGQTVGVREHPTFGIVVTFLADGEPGQQVVEVGPEHIVVEAPGTGGRTRLPRYLLVVEPRPQGPAQRPPEPPAQQPLPVPA
jgi:hypothetical protein